MINNSQKAFLELVKAGLWGDVNPEIRIDGTMDWQEVYQLATEQSVLGLVLDGLEHSDVKPPQMLLLQWIGEVQVIEQRNKEMNAFVAELIEKLRKEDIYALLVKGQGVAQCYERPLWRFCGDVDLLLSEDNYHRAIDFLTSIADESKYAGRYSKEYVVRFHPWTIELHGTLRTGLSYRLDKSIDDVQRDVFYRGNARSWDNKGTTVFLPSSDNDVFFVFSHFIKHFYKEGMNLRQVCDWCRLIWTFRSDLDLRVLETRIRKAGLMAEWKAFAALAVEYLGMPKEAMPMYELRFRIKGSCALKHILKGEKYSKVKGTWAIAKIFPWNTIKFLPSIFLNVNWLKIKERFFERNQIN